MTIQSQVEILLSLDARLDGLTKTIKGMDEVKKKSESVGTMLKRGLSLAGAVTSIDAAVSAVRTLTRDTIRYYADLNARAETVGVSTRFLQGFTYAAEQNQIGVNAAALGLQRFTRRMAEARAGGGELKAIFEQLDISLTTSTGRFKTNREVLGEVADRIAAMKDPADQLRVAFKMFDSEGAALVKLLRDGSAGLDEWMEKAQDFTLSDESIQKLAEAENQIGRLTTRLKVLSGESIAAGLDTFDRWADILDRISSSSSDLGDRGSGVSDLLGELYALTGPGIVGTGLGKLVDELDGTAAELEEGARRAEEIEEKLAELGRTAAAAVPDLAALEAAAAAMNAALTAEIQAGESLPDRIARLRAAANEIWNPDDGTGKWEQAEFDNPDYLNDMAKASALRAQAQAAENVLLEQAAALAEKRANWEFAQLPAVERLRQMREELASLPELVIDDENPAQAQADTNAADERRLELLKEIDRIERTIADRETSLADRRADWELSRLALSDQILERERELEEIRTRLSTLDADAPEMREERLEAGERELELERELAELKERQAQAQQRAAEEARRTSLLSQVQQAAMVASRVGDMSDALSGAIIGVQSWGEAWQQVGQSSLSIITSLISRLLILQAIMLAMNAVGAMFGVPNLGTMLVAGGASFGGMFAEGGNLPNGQWGVVGERGPELIESMAGGTKITPLSQLSAGFPAMASGAAVAGSLAPAAGGSESTSADSRTYILFDRQQLLDMVESSPGFKHRVIDVINAYGPELGRR